MTVKKGFIQRCEQISKLVPIHYCSGSWWTQARRMLALQDKLDFDSLVRNLIKIDNPCEDRGGDFMELGGS